MAPPPHSSRILEIKLISAQDLAPISKSMKTYAVAWVTPDRKLTTRVDETNHTNPVWNEKFVFKIDDKFFYDEESVIMVEIYAAAWVKDALIGTISVSVADLFTPWTDFNKSSTMRFISLQVRRPTGRPQGMVSMGISLLDNTLRSMPMFTDQTTTKELDDTRKSFRPSKLRRVNSDSTDLTSSDDYYYPPGEKTAASFRYMKGGLNGGSMVNGGSFVNGSFCSDVGPSASVVAAAIANGLYYHHRKSKNNQKEDTGSLILQDNEEDMKDKLERWRTEASPDYQNKFSKSSSLKVGDKGNGENDDQSSSNSHKSRRRKRGDRNGNGDGNGKENGKGLFSCFGNVFGCEISITCGGGDEEKRKKKKKKKSNKVVNLSSVDGTYSSVV